MNPQITVAPIRLLFLSVLATCAIAGCASSENPLSSRESGFVDRYLHGAWRPYDVVESADGLELALSDENFLFVTTNESQSEVSICNFDGEGRCCWAGHSTLLDGQKYFNFRASDTGECEGEEPEECAYWIFRYETFASDLFLSHLSKKYGVSDDVAGQVLSDFDGRLVIVWYLSAEAVEEAIRTQQVKGKIISGLILDEVCLAAESEALQSFFAHTDSNLFPEPYWIFVRESFETKF
jgi:hypothetical protein